MENEITENVFFERGYNKGYSDAFENVSRKITQNVKYSSWISIDEEVPDPEKSWLLFFFALDGFLGIGEYYGLNEEGKHVFGGCAGFIEGEVTHWMTAPEPPTNCE